MRRRLALTSTLLLATLTVTAAITTAPTALAAPMPRTATGIVPDQANPRCQSDINLAIDRNRQAIALVDGRDFPAAARANELTMADITKAADVCPGHIRSKLENAHYLAHQAYQANSAGGGTGVQQAQYEIDSLLRDALRQVG